MFFALIFAALIEFPPSFENGPMVCGAREPVIAAAERKFGRDGYVVFLTDSGICAEQLLPSLAARDLAV